MIDCTILGMGRGAGNLKTELMLTYLKSTLRMSVDLNVLGKLIELYQPLLDKYRWGTNLAYIVSGSYSLPQKEVMDALKIDRYSLSGIVNSLKSEESMVLNKFYKDEHFLDSLIIGGGESVSTHMDAIKSYLNLNGQILVMHATSKYIDFFEDIDNVQYFIVGGNELVNISKKIEFIDKYIFEPSPRKINIKIDKKKNLYELEEINFIDNYFDSPLTLSLQVTLCMDIDNIFLIGFDGYGELKNEKELYLMQENQNIIDSFSIKKKLSSLTPTKYNNIYKRSFYTMID